MAIKLRTLTPEEKAAIAKLARSRTAAAREVERARIIFLASKRKAGGCHCAGVGTDGDHRAHRWVASSLSTSRIMSAIRLAPR